MRTTPSFSLIPAIATSLDSGLSNSNTKFDDCGKKSMADLKVAMAKNSMLGSFAHGHAVLGTYTSKGGGTGVTSGSTDWAHGLAGRDPQIEQITRNILDRLSA